VSRPLILLLLAAVNFTHIIDAMLIMPLGDIFVEEFNIGAEKYSFLVGAYSFGAFVSSIGGIFFMDRFDRKSALLSLFIGFAIGTFLCSFVQSFEVFVLLRFVTGCFGGILGSLIFAIVADLYKFHERGYAMGVIFGAFSAASVMGVPFSLWIAASFNWTVPFQVLGGFAGAMCLVVAIYFPNMKDHLTDENLNKSNLQVLKFILQDSNQLTALGLGAILILGHYIIIPFISPVYIKNVGFTQFEISYMFFFGGLATVISAPIVGKMVDRFGVFPVFVTTLLLSFIPTIVITHMETNPLWYALIYSSLFFVFASSRMISANTIITAAVGTETRGSFMSIKAALQQLSIFAVTILGGQIVFLEDDQWQNYEYLGYLSVIICLFTIPLIKRIKVAEGN
jgi:predicted MFS family arabinose efflux permease